MRHPIAAGHRSFLRSPPTWCIGPGLHRGLKYADKGRQGYLSLSPLVERCPFPERSSKRDRYVQWRLLYETGLNRPQINLAERQPRRPCCCSFGIFQAPVDTIGARFLVLPESDRCGQGCSEAMQLRLPFRVLGRSQEIRQIFRGLHVSRHCRKVRTRHCSLSPLPFRVRCGYARS